MDADPIHVMRLVRKVSEQEPLVLTRADLADFLPADACEEVASYFTTMLAPSQYAASGIYIVGLEELRDCFDYDPPGSFITPFGFRVIAGTVGGNAVVVDAATGEVRWADHESFSEVDDEIGCPPPLAERKTGSWTYVKGHSRENVLKALHLLDPSLLSFMSKCLRGELEETLDAID